MKQKLTLIFLLFISAFCVSAQKFPYSTKPALIGLHYTLVDYNSPTLIKNTSLKEVIRRGDIFNPKRQSSAFTVSFWKGLAKNIDFSAKFNGIFYDYALHNNPTGPQYNNEFGSELEAALNFKLFSDAHFLTPFITAGIGGGYYTNKFGEYVPAGLGLQLNFEFSAHYLLFLTLICLPLQAWPHHDPESRPTIAYCWKNIGAVRGDPLRRYMRYMDDLECLTQNQVLYASGVFK